MKPVDHGGSFHLHYRWCVSGCDEAHTPNDVFIDGEAERQSNLLSDSRAALGGIALLGGENRVNEFFAGTLGTGLALAFRGEKQAVLALGQDPVKVQKGRRLQNKGRMDQPGRPHK